MSTDSCRASHILLGPCSLPTAATLDPLRFTFLFIDVVGWKIVRPAFLTCVATSPIHFGLQVAPVLLGSGIDTNKSYLDVTIFMMVATIMAAVWAIQVAATKKRIEGKERAKALCQESDGTLKTPTDLATGTHLPAEATHLKKEQSLLTKALPALILLAFFVVGLIIVRVYPLLPEGAPRFCVRIFSWPVLQSVGSGLMRQNVALGSGIARSRKLAVGLVSEYTRAYVCIH